mmetsp:Transcript_64992/g.168937  ORF Transcript_64992/g.168937 Transcript_64992/m.168937 type:complete len:210 (+) Transcript_64992:1620-2249(+)
MAVLAPPKAVVPGGSCCRAATLCNTPVVPITPAFSPVCATDSGMAHTRAFAPRAGSTAPHLRRRNVLDVRVHLSVVVDVHSAHACTQIRALSHVGCIASDEAKVLTHSSPLRRWLAIATVGLGVYLTLSFVWLNHSIRIKPVLGARQFFFCCNIKRSYAVNLDPYLELIRDHATIAHLSSPDRSTGRGDSCIRSSLHAANVSNDGRWFF